jgi:hypothetical protein
LPAHGTAEPAVCIRIRRAYNDLRAHPPPEPISNQRDISMKATKSLFHILWLSPTLA